jgi:hypothetical protein
MDSAEMIENAGFEVVQVVNAEAQPSSSSPRDPEAYRGAHVVATLREMTRVV